MTSRLPDGSIPSPASAAGAIAGTHAAGKTADALIARAPDLSRAEVHGVMSFYHDFRAEPAGEHTVPLCRAEACQAMGARALERHVQQRLGIGFGETTKDGLFTLEPVYCLGNCACPPSIRINDELHARVSPEKFDELIARLEAAG